MFTPREIRDTEFDRVSRGYNIEDVDAFLKQIADQMDKLLVDQADTQKQIQPLLSRVEQYKTEENAIRSALVSAEKMRESIVNEASQQRDILVRDAENKSQRMIDDALARVKQEANILDDVKAQVAKFKNELLNMYEGHIRLIGSIPDLEMPTYNEKGDMLSDGRSLEPVAIVDKPEQEVQVIEEPVAETVEEEPVEQEIVDEAAEVQTFADINFDTEQDATSDAEQDFTIDNFTIDKTIDFDENEYNGFAPRDKDSVATANEKFGKLDFGDGFSFNK